MSIGIVFQQMLVLFGMMAIGYVCYRKNLIEERGMKTISAVIVTVLNPFLAISSILNKEVTFSGNVIRQNLVLVGVLFGVLILLSALIVRLMRLSRADRGSYRLMLIFSNIGFMGIPLVSNIYGPEAVFLVAFYMLTYNILIYTYGIFICFGELDQTDGNVKFEWKKMINPGMVSCTIAVLLFAFDVQLPSFVGTFTGYMGNAAIPLSMMMVGVNLARIDLRTVFTDVRLLMTAGLKLLVIPIAAVLILKQFGFDQMVLGVFIIMLATPVGSIVTLVESQYGREDNNLCARGIALTTLLSLVTLPIVAFFC